MRLTFNVNIWRYEDKGIYNLTLDFFKERLNQFTYKILFSSFLVDILTALESGNDIESITGEPLTPNVNSWDMSKSQKTKEDKEVLL